MLVCVKCTGKRRGKLGRHDFSGIFLGYLSTDQNIRYLDLLSGVVKTCHCARFNEAWYLQHNQPPGPQLLYDLGLKADDTFFSKTGPDLPYTSETQQWMGLNGKVQTSSYESKCTPRKLDFYK